MTPCTKPHRIPCLMHKEVISGKLPPCPACAPQLAAAQATIQESADSLIPSKGGLQILTRKRPADVLP